MDNTLREAAEMALEALEEYGWYQDPVLHLLRKALAQPEQEPVAWITRRNGDGGVVLSGYETCEPIDYDATPVYTAPPSTSGYAKKIESLIKERDELRQALAQPEQGCAECGVKASDGYALYCVACTDLFTQPEQEPVAWLHPDKKVDVVVPSNLAWFDKPLPLYTAPPSKQEPVAWVRDLTSPQPHCVTSLKYRSVADTDAGVKYIPVYVAPPSKPWVSLTDEEIKEGAKSSWVDYQAFQSVAWWADEKLKGKNT